MARHEKRRSRLCRADCAVLRRRLHHLRNERSVHAGLARLVWPHRRRNQRGHGGAPLSSCLRDAGGSGGRRSRRRASHLSDRARVARPWRSSWRCADAVVLADTLVRRPADGLLFDARAADRDDCRPRDAVARARLRPDAAMGIAHLRRRELSSVASSSRNLAAARACGSWRSAAAPRSLPLRHCRSRKRRVPRTDVAVPIWKAAEPRELLAQREFQLFLIAAGLVQAAHATFLTFATLLWQKQGISATWSGGLWAIGVAAEVLLFSVSGRVVEKFGAGRLIAIGAAVSIVRWVALAMEPSVAVLVPLQVLHGVTYGASHIGAIHFIHDAIPRDKSGSAQALYATVASGIAMGCATLIAGWVYADAGSLSYLAMAAIAAVSLMAASAARQDLERRPAHCCCRSAERDRHPQSSGSGGEMQPAMMRSAGSRSRASSSGPSRSIQSACDASSMAGATASDVATIEPIITLR